MNEKMNKQFSAINTTRLDVKNLKPINDEVTVYQDKKKKGFLIEVTNQGLAFFYEYKFNKEIRTLSLGSYPSVSLSKALQKWEVASKKVLDGKDIWLYEDQSVVKNPASLQAADNSEELTRILNPTEIKKFWMGLDSINEISAITRLGLKLILLTGCSKDELFNATWDDINFEYRVWIATNSKKDERELDLSTLAIETFLEIQDFEHHTAYSNNKIKKALMVSQNKVLNLSSKSLDRAIDEEGCKKLAIKEFNLEDLQASYRFLHKEHSDTEKVGNYISELVQLKKI
jgi:integrase